MPLQEPALAVGELERAVKELGLRGVEICTNVAGAELSEERFRPFFAKVQELDVVIFMHPNGFTHGQRLADHYFINIIGNPLDSTVAVHHLIFGGVLEAYPKLKIVVAHGGGFLPAYSGRIDHGHRARPDARRVITKKPTSYLKKLYYDTIVFTHHQLEYLAELWGADHLLLGTDYPYDMALPKAVNFVETADLSGADRAAILGGTAARAVEDQTAGGHDGTRQEKEKITQSTSIVPSAMAAVSSMPRPTSPLPGRVAPNVMVTVAPSSDSGVTSRRIARPRPSPILSRHKP